MNTPDLIGWIGNIGFMIGAYLVARQTKKAFFALGIGNFSYIVQGFMLKVPSLTVISFYLLSMNIYGYLHWTKNGRNREKIIGTNTTLRKG